MSAIYDPRAYIRNITIVGLGGTGAQVARIVGRMAYDRQRAGQSVPEITLIDPDVIEAQNVGRQLFAPAEVGQPKAAVIGRRLNLALGLAVRWIPEKVDAKRHFDHYGGGLILSCVDNHEARQQLHATRGVLVSAGNHEDSGQVIIGDLRDPVAMRNYLDNLKPGEETFAHLPTAGLLFPELLEPEPEPLIQVETPPGASCAELVAAGSQHLLVNDFMAAIVGQYAYKLLYRQPIHSFMTTVDTETLVMRSHEVSRENLDAYLSERQAA